eukprot:CAMPEP_0183326788 /NCGR_PEP_ID=MMETSP0160_2-20130417/83149_1 /TAXON_ID=2839 ORGANISM="Odontella Sinensis, Strain Grunow 1884" /NCGR_SAMPLE_ID=MMETSP0160_2 /ASSEMBLY_ACC=CAM_ASM_000250 /LENGTH=54 /DNA_ID=CAMNT_0025494857 /DNA_START=27 /DNA_END=191 /DNA_ORIENTATION=-
MGAFGWWAGWLSGGTVVYYKDLYGHVGKGGKNRILPDHHWPKSWIGFGHKDFAI